MKDEIRPEAGRVAPSRSLEALDDGAKLTRAFVSSLRRLALTATCLLLVSLAVTATAAPDYRFHPQTLSLLNELKDALVRHKLCVDRERCSSEQIVFASPESWGVAIEVYGIDDQAVLQDLTAIVSANFFRTDAVMSIELRIYSGTKAQALSAPMFRKPKPITEIRWEDRNADR